MRGARAPTKTRHWHAGLTRQSVSWLAYPFGLGTLTDPRPVGSGLDAALWLPGLRCDAYRRLR